ncbi:MAG: hypothetical protein GX562_01670 [Coriobacteriaceae bacterium]|nr:hypothetical protein [Coriobacteriaceae bacterium]
MAQAARAYQDQYQTRWQQAPVRSPHFTVVSGKARDTANQQALSPQAMLLFKMVIAMVVFVSLVAGLRVWVTTATVQELIESQSITQSITEARAAGMELEVKHSVLANPNRIQEIASEQLGMSPASQVAYLDATVKE